MRVLRHSLLLATCLMGLISEASAQTALTVYTAVEPELLPVYIDRNVSFTDLKQALLLFAQEMFGKDTKIRLRPSYFPFTEPSAEMDISCNICGGKGCPFCKKARQTTVRVP